MDRSMRTTRRVFLRTAAAAPLVLPAVLRAAQTAPNEQITVGMIGTGRQSRGLVGHFLARSRVVAVCDVDTTRREDLRQRVNTHYTTYPDQGTADCAAYTDFEHLLARKDIDAVCIATPDHWHALITLAALKAGKDVYCEKPLTHNISESVAVMKAVDAYGRILQTGSMQRSSREFRVACELARNGAAGRIERIECSFGDPAIDCDLPEEPLEPGLDWNLWLGPAEYRPYHSELSPRGIHDHWPNWRRYRQYGGGAVADWGAHHLDIAQWALGMDDSGPVAVLPPEKRGAKRGARLVYANGVEVVHKDGFGVHIFGTEGEILVNRGKFWFIREGKTVAKFTQREDGGTLDSALSKAEREYLKDAKVQLYRVRDNHIGDFLEAMRTRRKPITHEGVGARSAICCHLLNLVYYYGQPIKWNPATCTFADGSGDPRWLSGSRRDYRKQAGQTAGA
jgi:predicted dehydrogenase